MAQNDWAETVRLRMVGPRTIQEDSAVLLARQSNSVGGMAKR
jgi:hypothetical protein